MVLPKNRKREGRKALPYRVGGAESGSLVGEHLYGAPEKKKREGRKGPPLPILIQNGRGVKPLPYQGGEPGWRNEKPRR
jgi:hypothetical protein